MTTPRFEVRDLSLELGGHPVLRNVEIAIQVSEIVCLLGPSGSGKSTLLRCLNRLIEPPAQSVFFDARDVTKMDVLALRRRVGMVFQQAALFPGTVADNVAFGPVLSSHDLSDGEIAELLDLADLSPDYTGRPVDQLSGGEAQRVSMARALANRPDTLLLDEPTSALDPAARRHVRETIIRLRQDLGLTVIWVTHNVEEAAEVADRVYLLVEGRIVDQGAPEHLLRPDSLHKTAEFAAGQLE